MQHFFSKKKTTVFFSFGIFIFCPFYPFDRAPGRFAIVHWYYAILVAILILFSQMQRLLPSYNFDLYSLFGQGEHVFE